MTLSPIAVIIQVTVLILDEESGDRIDADLLSLPPFPLFLNVDCVPTRFHIPQIPKPFRVVIIPERTVDAIGIVPRALLVIPPLRLHNLMRNHQKSLLLHNYSLPPCSWSLQTVPPIVPILLGVQQSNDE